MTNPNIHIVPEVLITNGHVLTMDGEFKEIPEGAVSIHEGKIVRVGTAEAADYSVHPEYTIDAKGGLIIPGFINGHCHSAMTLFRGLADDLLLDDFLKTVWEAEYKHVHHHSVLAGAFLGCAEMAKGGITTFADMYWHPKATVEAANMVGLNVIGGPVFVGFKGADKIEDWDQKIKDARDFVEEFRAHEGVHISLAPHSCYTLDKSQLQQIAALAAEFDVPIQIHASEAPSEMKTVRENFDATPIEVLKETGILDGPCFIAHGVHLNSDDRELLKNANAGVVHCPLSNAKTAAGIAPIVELLKEGVSVGLGTDGPSTGNDLDIFKAMRHCAMMQILKHSDPTVMAAREVVKMATSGGAKAVGLGDITGTLERGMQADVVVISADSYHMTSYRDPYSALVYSAGREDVSHVFSRGHHIVNEGRLMAREIGKYAPKFKFFSNYITETSGVQNGV